MKTIQFFLTFLLITTLVQAQVCDDIYYMSKAGQYIEITQYDAKHKPTMVQYSKVSALESIPNGVKFKIHSKMEMLDEKEKEDTPFKEFEIDMECRDGVFYLDFADIFRMQPNYNKEMDGQEIGMEISGDHLAFPSNMKPGDLLPDATTKISMMNGMMNITSRTIERKVEAEESVTTSAGTFTCLRISQTSVMEMLGTRKSKSTMWLAKNIGIVKMENFDKKGKLSGSMEMTKLGR